MKILFDVNHSFSYCHGGVQVLVENIMKCLPDYGVKVEPLRWWEKNQSSDILQLFYNTDAATPYAKQNGVKIVNYCFLDGYTSKGRNALALRKYMIMGFQKYLPNYANILGWNYGDIADAYVYPSLNDMNLGTYLFGADKAKSHVILHGVDDKYLEGSGNNEHRADYLVCVSTIHERKNSLLLARIARELQIPVVFIGKPYSEDNGYYREFLTYVDGKYVIYEGFVDEATKISYLKKARGFILLSKSESGCIVVLEALACGCPVFLSDLSWAKSIYDGYAQFGSLSSESVLKNQILSFYNTPKIDDKQFPVLSWQQVTRKYLDVYESL
ncbi:MAG: glycosyltransferase family 4 protein [Pedobacter sp.]